MLSAVVRRGVRSSINNHRASLARNASTASSGKSAGVGIPPSLLNSWYNIFGKSNAAYVTWIVGGVLVGELVTGYGVDTMWNSVNSGRTYEQVDWQKFVVADDDDDDEDDEEEEEEEGDAEGDAEEDEDEE